MASTSFKIFDCSCCIIAVALSCPVAGISDADWVSIGSAIAGINGVVYAVVADDSGILYAGGSFTVAGRTCANNIARWDGNSWSALGSGTTGEVRALAVDGSHNLFAGGGFDNAGGEAASHIARWNGSTWSALGSGMDGSRFPFVRSLAIDSSGNLYAGGDFDIIGTMAVSHIAKWNGRAWSALGSGINRGYDGLQELPNINALCVDGVGNLYAGGNFDTAGGQWVNRIARWNGTAWNALGSAFEGGILQAVSLINAVTINRSGDLYVCGEFTVADGFSRYTVAKWNGRNWSNLGSGMSNELYCLALDRTGNLYAGGYFSTADGKDMRSIAQWNGNAWGALGTGSYAYGTIIRTLAVDRAGKLYAGGDFTFAFGITANHVAQWNGSSWSALGIGVNKSVRTLAADSSGNLYATGDFDTAGGIAANHIAKWDGSTWSALGSGTNGTIVGALAADGSGNLYGIYDTIGAVAAHHIAKWDGSAWLPLGNGISGSINALALDAWGNIYSSGTINDTTLSVFKWDGTLWKSLGSGIGAPLNRPKVDTKDALIIDKSGTVYLAAHSTDYKARGYNNSTVVRWNGGSWDTLAAWPNSAEDYFSTCLTIDNSGNLYVGGRFDTIGGIAAKNVARWDGRVWSALGSGTNFSDYSTSGGEVAALTMDGSGNLYAGGEFTVAGGKVSAHVAQCRLKNTGTLSRGGDKAFMTYNPRCRTIRFYLKAPEKISCRIFSLSGREVIGSSEFLPVGDHVLKINGVRLAPGAYIVQARTGKELTRFKMTVER